jgi:hypothetical protein
MLCSAIVIVVSAMACDRFKFVGVKPLPKEEALSKGE